MHNLYESTYIKLLEWHLAPRKCAGSIATIIMKVLVKFLGKVAENTSCPPRIVFCFLGTCLDCLSQSPLQGAVAM